jgi:hypothetical protein
MERLIAEADGVGHINAAALGKYGITFWRDRRR